MKEPTTQEKIRMLKIMLMQYQLLVRAFILELRLEPEDYKKELLEYSHELISPYHILKMEPCFIFDNNYYTIVDEKTEGIIILLKEKIAKLIKNKNDK